MSHSLSHTFILNPRYGSPNSYRPSNSNTIFSSLNSSSSNNHQPDTHSDTSFEQRLFKNNNPASCSCGRRCFLGASGTLVLPTYHSLASEIQSDPKDMLNRIHPPRPDWYEEFYALAMEKSMKPYEAEVSGLWQLFTIGFECIFVFTRRKVQTHALPVRFYWKIVDYKADLFTKLRGKSKVLELGIGTGPNLRYYAGDADVFVFGVDPNKRMERYAQAAAAAAGLPSTHFSFIEAVGEALPVKDASMDAVIGTLVLCSVKDVKLTLQEVKRVLKPGGSYIFIEHVAAKEGTSLRFIQNVFDPLQQIVSDGCHLTRETGKHISQAGFSDININTAFLSNASLIGPHVYGMAFK